MITRRRAKMASNSDSVEFDVNNQLGTVNTEDNTTPSEPSSVVESPEDRARGQTSKLEEGTLQMLMEFIRQQNEKQKENIKLISEESNRKQEENINRKLEESSKLINEELEKQEERSKKQEEKQEENCRLINEKLDQHKEEITQIRSEIRESQQTWERKVDELQKKQDDIVRDLREEANKKYVEIQENDRQEWMAAVHTTQTTVKKINHKFDAHVKDYNKKHEELKTEIHDTILQKQQEQEGTNNNIIQKLTVDNVQQNRSWTRLRKRRRGSKS